MFDRAAPPAAAVTVPEMAPVVAVDPDLTDPAGFDLARVRLAGAMGLVDPRLVVGSVEGVIEPVGGVIAPFAPVDLVDPAVAPVVGTAGTLLA